MATRKPPAAEMAETPATPSLASVDPFDPANFTAARFTEVDAAAAVVVMCPVRKPDKGQFIRASAEPRYTVEAAILEDRESRDTPYLVVDPSVAHSVPEHVKFVTLTLCVTRGGDPFLWPITNPAMAKRSGSTWADSALRARTAAMQQWVRISANMSKGGYDVRGAVIEIPEPIWPPMSMRDLIEMAFGESGLITSEGHPVIQRLLGRI